MELDNKNIDLNLFRTFFLVAETGSISKTAEKLFVSQPSISYSIKSLENSLDVKLFNRTGKGVVSKHKWLVALYTIQSL